jgi:hypothetical protein
MKRYIAILALIVLALSQKTIACDCDSTGDFLAIAARAEMVALVKVTNYLNIKNRYGRETAAEMEIIEVYRGTETRKTITFWGSTGKDCRPLVSQLEVGKYYVIAFNKCYADGVETTNDYTTSICGIHWLVVDINSQHARGEVGENKKEIQLTVLKEKLKQNK